MRYIPDPVVKLYDRSPIFWRNWASTGYWILKRRKEYNRKYYEFSTALEESEFYSLDKLKQIQSDKIRAIIQHCSINVPYYQMLFAENGIIPSQIQTPDDLDTLPVLTKEIIREKFDTLIATNFPKFDLRVEVTSGTTGKPLTVLMNSDAHIYSNAVWRRNYSWAGYKIGRDWIARLVGYKVVPLHRNKPPFWIKNYIGKQLHLSSYHLNERNALAYFKILQKSNVKFLAGYPSALSILANFFKNLGLVYNLNGVFVGAEPIWEWQAELIKDVFNCNIYNFYSQAERVVHASGCGNSLSMHVNMEACVLQLDDTLAGLSNIRGTSLLNYGMPLINYSVNDLTEGFDNACTCGRNHPLLKPVTTKLEDNIQTPSGNLIPSSLLTFAFKTPKGIFESQVVQKAINSIVVKLVVNENYRDDEGNKIINDIHSIVGDDMTISIEIVDEIPRSKNGKFRFIVSEI